MKHSPNSNRRLHRVPQIHLATVASRKTAYIQAAAGEALADWCIRKLDEAMNYPKLAQFEATHRAPFRVQPGHVETRAHIWIEASLERKRAYNQSAKAQTPPLALAKWCMGVLDAAAGYEEKQSTKTL